MNHLQFVFDLAERRDRTLYNWLRYLVGLSAGGLTLLVSLNTAGNMTLAERILGAVTLGSVALGILAGSIALFAEVSCARTLVQKASLDLQQQDPLDETSAPVVVPTHRVFRTAEKVCYLSLSLAVISLAAFGILRLF